MNLEKAAKYQIWANDIVREIVISLTEEEFVKENIQNLWNIQDLCIHIILAIEWNLETVIHKKAVDFGEMYEEYAKLPKEELLKKWKGIDERLLEYIKNMGKEKVKFPDFLKGDGMVKMSQEDYYFQYLTHTIYHRGQLMTALKSLGKEGKTTDYLNYLFEKDSA